MHFNHISERPLIPGGRELTIGNYTIGHAQNVNIVPFDGRLEVWFKNYEKLTVNGDNSSATDVPPQFWLAYIHPLGYDEVNSVVRGNSMFNGRNIIYPQEVPVLDFATDIASDGSQAPLDVYTYSGARSEDISQPVVAAGDLEVGVWYSIKDAGTSDFTLVGSTDNVAGTIFKASGTTTGTGEVYRTIGGRIGDIRSVAFNNKIYHYLNVYDYADSNSNRLALVTAELVDAGSFSIGVEYQIQTLGNTDWNAIGASASPYVGEKFTATGVGSGSGSARLTQFVQEIQAPDSTGNFGYTVGPLFEYDSALYALVGSPKVLIKSADGITWSFVNGGEVKIPLSTVDGTMRRNGMPVGAAFQEGDYQYALIPASGHGDSGASGVNVTSNDWPEGIHLFRKPLLELETSGLWEEYPYNPIALRAPDKGGKWQLAPFYVNGQLYAVSNDWGMIGFSKVNTSSMNTMRETPYSQSDILGFKHIVALKACNKLALDAWDYFPVEDGGTYQFSIGNKYLSYTPSGGVFSDELAFSNDPTSNTTYWVLEKQAEAWLIKPFNDTSQSIAVDRTDGQDNAGRAIGITPDMRGHDLSSAEDNVDHHFFIYPFGGEGTKLVLIQNRFSSLYLHSSGTQQPYLTDNHEFIFKVTEVV